MFVRVADPILNYFEPHGLLYLGFIVLFLLFGSSGGLGFLIFFRNQKKIRAEISVPRLVFTFSSPPLFLLFRTLLIAWLFPVIVQKKITLSDAFLAVDVGLILALTLTYAAFVRAALRWPTRTTVIALWFNVGLVAVGVTAKVLSLFLKK